MAPAVAAYQAMRGVAFMTAVTLVVEIGDIRRFDSARQLMAYLGLVPSESSTGERVRRGGITKAGNARARRALIEGAWTYRYPARISPVPSGVKVWLATGYTDMRRGFPGLSLMVQETLKRSDERPSVRLPGPERPITNILHTVFVLRRSHILGIRCSGERCRSRRIGAARA